MDIEKLIEQLNGYFEGKDLKRGVALDAATALSTLQTENEKLRGYINDLETQHRTEMCENGYDCVELGKLRAELARVTAERDDARATLDWFQRHGIKED